jgi:MFS transporter, DHA1 family, tetracycline resistance protein
VEVLGFSIIIPLFPYLTKNIMSPIEVGCLQSSNALAQLIATPFIGALSDKYGRRPLLLSSVLSTFISFLILANTESKFWIFFSRVLDGLIGGNIALANAYITDITSEDERSKGMGIIGSAFGLGFVIGPALGGFLMSYHHTTPSYASALLSFVNLVCLYLFLEESLPLSKRKKDMINIVSFSEFMLHLFKICVTNIEILQSLASRYIYIFTFTLFEYSFTFFSINRLHNNATTSGLLLGWFGIMYSISQAFGIRVLRKKFPDDTLFLWSIFALPWCYFFLFLVNTNNGLFISLIPLGLVSGMLNTLSNTRVSNEIKKIPGIIGGGLGISSALGSFARIVAPPFAGYIFQSTTDKGQGWNPFFYCAIISCFLIVIRITHRN